MFLKSKYSKLLVSFVVCLLLLISLNISVFADSSGTYKFSELQKQFFYVSNKEYIDVTSQVTVSYGNVSVESLNPYNPVTTFRYPANFNSYNKLIWLSMPLSFTCGSEYRIKFSYTSNFSSSASFNFLVNVISSNSGDVIDNVELYNGSIGSSYRVNSVDVSFSVPYYQQAFSCTFFCQISSGGGNSTVGQAFFFSDIVIENTAGDIYGTFNPPSGDHSTSDDLIAINSDIADLNSITINTDVLSDSLDVDMSEFNDGMVGLKGVIEQVISACSFTSVLTFALAFGICIYMLGRRLA